MAKAIGAYFKKLMANVHTVHPVVALGALAIGAWMAAPVFEAALPLGTLPRSVGYDNPAGVTESIAAARCPSCTKLLIQRHCRFDAAVVCHTPPTGDSLFSRLDRALGCPGLCEGN